jgi:hypothetical protein
MANAVDILIFIGQALAIAGIGYIVAQAFACTAKYRDPNWRPADVSTRALKSSGDAPAKNTVIQFSFVPEGLGRSKEDAADGNGAGKRLQA